MSKIPVKIITREEAINNGWSSPREIPIQGAGSLPFLVNVMMKKGAIVKGVKQEDEVLEISKTDVKTGKKELIIEKPEYKAFKKQLEVQKPKDQ